MTTAIDATPMVLPVAHGDGIRPIRTMTLAQRVQAMQPSETPASGIGPLAHPPGPLPPSTSLAAAPSPLSGAGRRGGDDAPMEWDAFFNKILTLEWFDGWLDRVEETVDNGER
ncbi:hypothetical protein AB870_12240 [Pandoraea faecigallinarum]|uniref:Uncharacterized protein n=1 Tax=Pandoraea faecigallinarum TaxID=656179 RepID=A0A0H3WRA7_9BURK|nr:hypothetical protein [Pandoraea faecigallinarum]AKM30714.1 hypothetical protein AB870_12240 [Pandoraea faecigallinarum]